MNVGNKWENACRLCAEQKKEMLPIFGTEGLQRKVAQKLRACLPVLVYKTDPLPKQICQFCAARLDDAYEFREYCLSVYKNMHLELLSCKNIESVQIFFNAMKSSPDPCQAKLCVERPRGPPPLVPLPISLPPENSVTMEADELTQSIEDLPELPCEVEIEEINSLIGTNDAICELGIKSNNSNIETTDYSQGKSLMSKKNKNDKPTSILEQVLKGNLTLNDRKDISPRSGLSSAFWCSPCNIYYKTKEALTKHLQLYCPRLYTCRKCSVIFQSVKDLAEHEATDHLKVILDCQDSLKNCDQCDRKFISWEMLKHHRIRDHLGEAVEIGHNTHCFPCNRFFYSDELYKDHMELHKSSNYSAISLRPPHSENKPHTIKIVEKTKLKSENTKSLMCLTCGKVCTQQSALSNHMRTHEPKRHKCNICGRSFGLFIRLAAHRLSEHNQQPVSPTMMVVEQEEALNAQREAKEARSQAGILRYSNILRRNDDILDEAPSKSKKNKNVARCGICLEWFNDHSTMLAHLKTHSDNLSCKTYNNQKCKKALKEKWQLSRHEVSHKRSNIAQVYQCNVCNKVFAEKSLHKAHQKTHTPDRSYHCSKCNKLFFKEVSLLTHQCNGNFAKKSSVSKQQTQNNSKKYKCSKCNASFSTSQSRNSHMRVHVDHTKNGNDTENNSMPTLTPETSLEVTVPLIEANVEISEGSPLAPLKRTLIRTAGGYRCGVCQSPFVLRELAVAHLRSAHPVMPYQCPYCKKRFTTQYTFTHHIKTEHAEEPEK
ncbi:zinc finger protein 569-like [Prorops nasuta]|uniref:zinc finger protein 569-like n=1 Tax=Prorops nasuta TaxID=863751 RepID=UPI0034CF7AE5